MRAFPSSRGIEQLGERNPKSRPFMKPVGNTCGRKRRMNSVGESVSLRSRELFTFR